jgi:C4-dicarboxylate-binding protein DctP
MLRLPACAFLIAMAASQATAETSNLTLAFPNEPDLAARQGALAFAEATSDATGFRVEVLFSVGFDEIVLRTQNGVFEMAAIPLWIATQINVNFAAFSLPFFSPDVGSIEEFLWTPEAQELLQSLRDYQLVGLTYWPNLSSNIFSQAPVVSVEDLNALKLTTAGEPTTNAILANLGVTLSPIRFPEVYNALRTGTVDAAKVSAQSAIAMDLDELLPYALPLGDSGSGYVIVASEQFWDALSENSRLQIIYSLSGATSFIFEQTKEDQIRSLASLEEAGFQTVAIDADDYSAFVDASRSASESIGIDSGIIEVVVASTRGGGDACFGNNCKCVNRTCNVLCCPNNR